nr:MAG TPA: endosialidase chaperone [Caudoviricetes sp.]
MSKIQGYLQNIMQAVYGKDVRQSIHDAIEMIDSVADTAKDSATASAKMAETMAENAGKYADEAQTCVVAAAASEANAAASETAVAESKDAAAASEANAKASEEAAGRSADTAAEKAAAADQSADTASEKAEIATEKAAEIVGKAEAAAASATKAESYAVGGTGSREGEDTDNAAYYYRQAKSISESFAGALRPMGTVAFSGLPELTAAAAGDMYNISDEFTTTDDFKEGAGNTVPAGANVYKTSDGKWDVLAGTPVTGVKGAKEAAYHRGNVSLSAADVGAVAEDGDASDTTVTFSTAAERVNITAGEKLSALFSKIAKWLSDLKPVAFSGNYSDLSNKPTIPTNTWRPVQDNLTSTSSTDSLSANQGRLLASGSARDNTKMPVTGGTFTGAVGFKNGTWNPVGDDCYMGDFNAGGCVAFKSMSSQLTGIALVGAGSNMYGRLLVQNDGGDMYLATNGAFYVSNGNNSARAVIHASAFAQDSSRRVKENIVDVSDEDAMKLLDLTPVNFDYIGDNAAKNCVGLIAEDVAPLLPKCVVGDVNCEDDDENAIRAIGIDYSKFTPYLIKMVQIQQAQIDAQQEQINKLAAQIL